MPGFFTDYANNLVLDLFFGSVTYTPPTTLYLGLSQSAATKTGSTAEPSGGGYARVAVANNLSSFPSASGGTKANAAVATFATPTASWGTVVSVFVADAISGGNVIAMADLTIPKTVNAGGTAPTVAAGALFLSHT